MSRRSCENFPMARQLWCASALFAALVTASCQTPKTKQQQVSEALNQLPAPRMKEAKTVRLPVLTVDMGARDGNVVPVSLTVAPNQLGTLDVTVSEAMSAGTGNNLRASLWKASFNAARIVGRELADYSIRLRCPEGVDGSSLGVLVVSGLVSLMWGADILPKVSITGSLLPDGTIGPVGGLPQKIATAIRSGIKTVGYPIGLRQAVDLKTGQTVDVEQMAIDLGGRAVELETIHDAVKLLTGKSFPRPDVLPKDKLAFTDQMRKRVSETSRTAIESVNEVLAALPEMSALSEQARQHAEDARQKVQRASAIQGTNPSAALVRAEQARNSAFAAQAYARYQTLLTKPQEDKLAAVVGELRELRKQLFVESQKRRYAYQHSFDKSHWNIVSYQLLIDAFYFTMASAKQVAVATAILRVLDGKPLSAPPGPGPATKTKGGTGPSPGKPAKGQPSDGAQDPLAKLAKIDKKELKKQLPEELGVMVQYAALGRALLEAARDYGRVDLKGADTAKNQMPEIDETLLRESSEMYIQASRANLVYYESILKTMLLARQLPRDELAVHAQLAGLATGAWAIPDQVVAPQWGKDATSTAMVRLAGAKESWTQSALLIYRAFYPNADNQRAHEAILAHGDEVVRRMARAAWVMTGTVPMSTRLFYQAASDYLKSGEKLRAMAMYLRAALEADFSVVLARVLGTAKKPKQGPDRDKWRNRQPSRVMFSY